MCPIRRKRWSIISDRYDIWIQLAQWRWHFGGMFHFGKKGRKHSSIIISIYSDTFFVFLINTISLINWSFRRNTLYNKVKYLRRKDKYRIRSSFTPFFLSSLLVFDSSAGEQKPSPNSQFNWQFIIGMKVLTYLHLSYQCNYKILIRKRAWPWAKEEIFTFFLMPAHDPWSKMRITSLGGRSNVFLLNKLYSVSECYSFFTDCITHVLLSN